MIKLRPYQEDLVNELRLQFKEGKKKVVLCAPTGSGKTIMFSSMVKGHLDRGGKVLILTDRIELLNQANGAFSQFDITPELISASSKPDLTKPCHVAMIETLYRRVEKYEGFVQSKTMIIIDEAHRTGFRKLFPYISDSCYVIGATATPHRSKSQPSMDEFYEGIAQKVDTQDLIDLGYLSKADSYGVDIDLSSVKRKGGDYDGKALGAFYTEQKVYRGVIQNYERLIRGKKTLLFASSIESSQKICHELKQAGHHARHMDSKMNKQQRDEVLSWFNSVKNGILCNVGILTTGFDQPDIEAVILYRATKSLPLFLQMVGRGSRVTKTKSNFTILDFGMNIKSHGFWEDRRTWTLEKEKKAKKKKEDVFGVRDCKGCGALIAINSKSCNYCGAEIKKSDEEKKKEREVELKKLTKPMAMERAEAGSVEDKVELTKLGLISSNWVLHNMTDESEARRFVSLMGWKTGWYYVNQDRFKVFKPVWMR